MNEENDRETSGEGTRRQSGGVVGKWFQIFITDFIVQ
jgi:hypothetical protein